MTLIQKQLQMLFREMCVLKVQVNGLVPLDIEGKYKTSFLKKLERARNSKTRFALTGRMFSRVK